LDVLSSSWILIFLEHFSGLLTVSSHGRLSGDGFLFAIFVYGLLTYWLAHASASTTHTKTAGLEWEGVTSLVTASLVTTHHHASSASKEVVIVIKGIHTESAHASERILLLLPLSTLFSHSHLTKTMLAHAHAHATHSSESIIEKVVLFIEEVSKWIPASKEFSEYVISILHVEVLEPSTWAKVHVGLKASPSATTTTIARLSSSI
jgi:pectate lyase